MIPLPLPKNARKIDVKKEIAMSYVVLVIIFRLILHWSSSFSEMSALDSNSELTELGRILARLPIEPILGKTLVLATACGYDLLKLRIWFWGVIMCRFVCVV